MRRVSFSSRGASAGLSTPLARRVRPDQMPSLAGQARDGGATDTAIDALVRLVNVTRIWKHWRKPVLIVVSRDAPEYYACLREVFSAAPWATVVLDRRHRMDTPERPRPWAIVHADRIDAEVATLAPRRPAHDVLSALARLLRWAWRTGVKIGEYAAYQTLPFGRG